MKKSLFILLLISMNILNADQFCMDNSKHLDTRDGCDNKKLHYVYCTCHCYEYPHDFKRGRCITCQHFHDPYQIRFVRPPAKVSTTTELPHQNLMIEK